MKKYYRINPQDIKKLVKFTKEWDKTNKKEDKNTNNEHR